MADDLNYDHYMREALQSLVGRVLNDISQTGELPGQHHFYISFLTQTPGVSLPAHLQEQYPETMTIIIDGWFDNLMVIDDRFSITLNFGGVGENLVIPFKAVSSFSDPHANFQLNFYRPKPDSDAQIARAPSGEKVLSMDKDHNQPISDGDKNAPSTPPAEKKSSQSKSSQDAEESEKSSTSSKVVQMVDFRKN